MEKEQIQMCKKERKKNDEISNILYVIKAYICLFVYIFITNEDYDLQSNIYIQLIKHGIIYTITYLYIY